MRAGAMESLGAPRRREFAAAVAALASGAALAAPGKPLIAAQIGNFDALEVVQLGAGMTACFDRINAQGGVRDRKLELLQLPDHRDPTRFAQSFQQATERGAIAVLCPYGSANIQALFDARLLDAIGPAVIGAIPGSEVFRNPGHLKLLHVRAGDGRQIAHIFGHIKLLGTKRVGVMAAANGVGRSGIINAREAAAQTGGMEVTAFEAEADAPALLAAAQKLAASEAESALVVGGSRFIGDAVMALGTASFRGFIYVLSDLSAEQLTALAARPDIKLVVAQVLPSATGIALPLQREFHAAMQKQGLTPQRCTAFHLEGYVCARVLVEGLRRSQFVDGQGLAWALRTATEIDLGGYPVDFTHGNAGSRYVDMAVLSRDGKLRY